MSENQLGWLSPRVAKLQLLINDHKVVSLTAEDPDEVLVLVPLLAVDNRQSPGFFRVELERLRKLQGHQDPFAPESFPAKRNTWCKISGDET